MSNFLKKTISSLLILTIVAGLAGVPQKAEAIGGAADTVIETGPSLYQQIAHTISAGATAVSTYGSFFQSTVLNTLFTTLAKQLIRQITASVVNWINSGFEGSPSFISNPGSFFLDVADQITGAFIAKEGGPLSSLCSPFSIDIRIALAFKYHPNVPERYSCTLGTIITNSKNAVKGASINGFTAGDFKQGGWPAFVSLTTEPQNNAYGAYLTADSELSMRVAGAQIAKKDEISNGNGFLSWRNPTCTNKIKNDNAALKKGIDGTVNSAIPTQSINTGGPNTNTSSDFSNTASAFDAFSMVAAVGATTPEATRNAAATSYDSAVTNTIAQESAASTFKGGDATAVTIKNPNDCPIETPGTLIQGTLLQHIGGPLLELELVDSINQIVGALAAQLVTTVLKGGLKAVSGNGPSDQSSYLNQIQSEAAGQAQTNPIKNSFIQSVEKYISDTLQYKTSKDQSLNTIIDVKNSYDSVKSCYGTKISSSQPPLTPQQIEQAQSKISQIDSTITTTIMPTATKLLREAQGADTRYTNLTAIRDEATTAKTANDLIAPTQKFNLMLQNQTLVTAGEIVNAQQELSATKSEAETMKQDATRKLQECQIFPNAVYGAGGV